MTVERVGLADQPGSRGTGAAMTIEGATPPVTDDHEHQRDPRPLGFRRNDGGECVLLRDMPQSSIGIA
jgi:hypothetical protein